MKRTLLSTLLPALLVFTLVSSTALKTQAQSTAASALNDEIELLRTDLDASRKATVAEALTLSEEESTAFWPAYRKYQLELAKIKDRKVKVILDFMESREDMTDDKAEEIMDGYFDYRSDELKLKKRYKKQFGKILSKKQVLLWLQVENKLDVLTDLQLSASIPLVE